LDQLARDEGTTLAAAARKAGQSPEFPARVRTALRGFFGILDALAAKVEGGSPADLCEMALKATGYVEYLTTLASEGPDPQSRIENLQELISAMREFEAREEGGLRAFLERSALMSDQDTLDSGPADTVKLMTLHSAKGLEFPLVFLTGLEQDLMPHILARESKAELEEERRLCYVGMTRAMDQLVLSWARQRYVFGTPQMRLPSPFLSEMPRDLVDETAGLPASSATFAEAARLLEEVTRPQKRSALRPGVRVHHAKFGFGIVLAAEGAGEDLTVTVSFNRFGRRKLLASLAKLEVV